MSEENVERVLAAHEAFNRGDVEGMVADIAPEFEYVTTGTIPGARGVYRGREGWMEFLQRMWSEFESPRVEINELIDAGDRVLASVTNLGRGKRSGVEVNWPIWQVWTVKDGKAVRGEGFTSKEEALEAAGLSE